MAIVEMSKLKLVGLSYQKESILNALHKTGFVEVRATEDLPETVTVVDNKTKEELNSKFDRARKAVEFFAEHLEKAKDKPYYPTEVQKDLSNFFVSYDEFMSIKDKEGELLNVIADLEDFSGDLLKNRTERVKLTNVCIQLDPFKCINEKLSVFKDTKTTKVFFGQIKQENLEALKIYLSEKELTYLEVLSGGLNPIISIVSFNTESEDVAQKLTELGFTSCQFDYEATASEQIEQLQTQISIYDKLDETTNKKVCAKANSLHDLKILTDYYKFQIEKYVDSERFRCTASTFVLEGYLPKENEVELTNTLNQVTEAIFIEYSEPSKEDTPPTLLKNKKLVQQTEFVTDMYSVPNYREIDPNKVVFFFFMLFMGVIMADVGYGVLMIVIGLLLARKQKVDNGTKRLWNIIAISGIFTILFGALFNSYFGVKLPYVAPLPDPVPTANSGMDNLMTILLCCLGLGVIQLAVGYFCKALNCFKQKDILGGIFDGLIWVIFFMGLVFAGFNFLVNYLMPNAYQAMDAGLKHFFEVMTLPGIIMLGGSVLVAALTAGRNEKGFGKFAKGFGAVYGLINLMSDILSYARLFGLMLSGMIIASTFNNMGLDLINGGIVGCIFGPIVIVVGHVFNIAMNVLGAYIHDSRLQYIEFFGKFYTGEGEKFTPLGSQFDYIYLTK